MNQSPAELSEVEKLKGELDGAHETIAALTSMLDRAFSMIEQLTDGKAALSTEELNTPKKPFTSGRLSYVNTDDVAKMLGCSKTTASKYMREAGAASIGSKLIAKRSIMVAFAEKTGRTFV